MKLGIAGRNSFRDKHYTRLPDSVQLRLPAFNGAAIAFTTDAFCKIGRNAKAAR